MNKIVGGESGRGARPCQVEDIRAVVQQCLEAEVPVFVKQLGSNATWNHVVPGCSVREHREKIITKDSKGGEMEEWPADLRVREMPKATVTA